MGKLSVEQLKKESRSLRGNLLQGLAEAGPYEEDGIQLLKFHGSYQQFDRDTATVRKQKGLEKEYSFMIRVRIPGGKITSDQYLALDDFADRYANSTLRATTRQTIQYHVILKGNLKSIIANINKIFLTTFATCGDVVRNVTTVSQPIIDPIYQKLREDATFISNYTLPKTNAYHEIWLDGKRIDSQNEGEPNKDAGSKNEDGTKNIDGSNDNESNENDPLYGTYYLPRKFKIGITIPEDNSIDVLTNDLGILALYDEEKRLQGYNFYLGGGFGTTHNNASTYPRLATAIAFIGANDLIAGIEAVVKLQRDNGDRSNRKHARLKYLVAERGKEWIKAKLEEYFGGKLEDPRSTPPLKIQDYMGWHEQGDGLLFLGLPIMSGRIKDSEQCKLRTALHEVVATYKTDVIFTPDQNIILSNIQPNKKIEIEKKLKNYGVIFEEDISPVLRWSLACPSLPTCGLGLAESERMHVNFIQEMELSLKKYGLERERFSVRITGCPNGCARPYNGDIGIVGRMPDHYAIFVGGDFEGTRLNFKLFDKVHRNELVKKLDPLFALFSKERLPNEGFGDFCHRFKLEGLLAVLT